MDFLKPYNGITMPKEILFRYGVILFLREKGTTYVAIGQKINRSANRAWQLHRRAVRMFGRGSSSYYRGKYYGNERGN